MPEPNRMPRAHLVTDADIALLRELARARSLVAASRSLGISRDRAVYRVARLARAFGGPVVRASRGGALHGRTLLTPLGDRVARGGFDSVELLDARPLAPAPAPNLLKGVYVRAPTPTVRVGRSLALRVAFAATPGERVALLLDPESIVLARHRFPSSARNVLPATVRSVRRPTGEGEATVVVRSGGAPIKVALTDETVRDLALAPGARVYLYVKATALRRVGGPNRPATRGSPRS